MYVQKWLVVVLVGIFMLVLQSSMAEEQKTANEASDKGNTGMTQDDLDGTISAYTEAIRLSPNNAEAYYGRAYTYGQKGEIDTHSNKGRTYAARNDHDCLYP